MRVGIIIYHKDIYKIYKKEWIIECLRSIYNQTYNKYEIYELNYDKSGINLIEEYNLINRDKFVNKHNYWNIEMENHVYAMNFLLDKCFKENNIDVVLNINLDDYYNIERFEIQIDSIIKEKYDIVASDFIVLEEGNEIRKEMEIGRKYNTNEKIKIELNRNKNIIGHPGLAYSKNFWLTMKEYPQEIPKEDLELWKKSINKNMKFKIISKYLFYHRLHDNQITSDNKRKKDGFILKRHGKIII